MELDWKQNKTYSAVVGVARNKTRSMAADIAVNSPVWTVTGGFFLSVKISE